MNDFMSALKKSADAAVPNVSVTENGAVGYKTTGKKLVDLNFMLSSLRNMSDVEIWSHFIAAYNENPQLALVWLFFARDIREGCGERRTFRIIFNRFCYENDEVALKLLKLVPFYGRWDDLTDVFFSEVPCNIRDEAFRIISKQLSDDLDNARARKSISLLAKWLPSANTSSKETRRNAEMLRNFLGWTPKQYRKTLSRLRAYIGVVEQQMSANEWGRIDYEKVPSRASMNYRDAFHRHDPIGYESYLSNVKEGSAKIHSGTLFPYDIVHAYGRRGMPDMTLEEQWKALPNKVLDNESTLVVVDGSGSMMSSVGGTGVTCMDVARSIGIYFAEKLKGPYYNSFITFSANPHYVNFADGLSLRSKLSIMDSYSDCTNTNIEKVFDLVLDTAVKNRLRQSDLPSNVLIISDMEFDQATCADGYYWVERPKKTVSRKLFDTLSARFAAHGYRMPRLVFWNVCSRTGTIPLTENDLGVTLVSGFSPNIADMVMSSELDPYKCLLAKLSSERYQRVWDALKE